MVDGRQYAPQAETHFLDSRIEGLKLEERGAFLRRDWSAAKSKVLEKAPLKEAQHRTAARRLA